MERPSPVPFPLSLVVKKGSNMCVSKSFGIPYPLSLICTCMVLLSFTSEVTPMIPPSFTASRALLMMFRKTCWSCPGRS